VVHTAVLLADSAMILRAGFVCTKGTAPNLRRTLPCTVCLVYFAMMIGGIGLTPAVFRPQSACAGYGPNDLGDQFQSLNHTTRFDPDHPRGSGTLSLSVGSTALFARICPRFHLVPDSDSVDLVSTRPSIRCQQRNFGFGRLIPAVRLAPVPILVLPALP